MYTSFLKFFVGYILELAQICITYFKGTWEKFMILISEAIPKYTDDTTKFSLSLWLPVAMDFVFLAATTSTLTEE